jgi:hypothetical protein
MAKEIIKIYKSLKGCPLPYITQNGDPELINLFDPILPRLNCDTVPVTVQYLFTTKVLTAESYMGKYTMPLCTGNNLDYMVGFGEGFELRLDQDRDPEESKIT